MPTVLLYTLRPHNPHSLNTSSLVLTQIYQPMRRIHSSSVVGHRKYRLSNLIDSQPIRNICGFAVVYHDCASSTGSSQCGLVGEKFRHSTSPEYYLHDDLTFVNEADFARNV